MDRLYIYDIIEELIIQLKMNEDNLRYSFETMKQSIELRELLMKTLDNKKLCSGIVKRY